MSEEVINVLSFVLHITIPVPVRSTLNDLYPLAQKNYLTDSHPHWIPSQLLCKHTTPPYHCMYVERKTSGG